MRILLKVKKKTSTIILIFGIQINTNLFIASLLINKFYKTIITIPAALLKNFLILKKVQIFMKYLFFYNVIVKLT